MNTTTRSPLAKLLSLLVVVCVATLAMAGSATAAKLITGKGVKNNSLTGVDVRDASLTGADVRNGSVTGADVAPKSIGPGQLADSTRSVVRFDQDDSSGIAIPQCVDTALDACDPLVSVTTAPGVWVVTASGSVDNINGVTPSLSTRCGLFRGGDVLTEYRMALAPNGDPGETQSFTFQAVVTGNAAAPVDVRCTEQPGENLSLVLPRLTAVKVDVVG